MGKNFRNKNGGGGPPPRNNGNQGHGNHGHGHGNGHGNGNGNGNGNNGNGNNNHNNNHRNNNNNNGRSNAQPTRACRHCNQWGHFDGACPTIQQGNGQHPPRKNGPFSGPRNNGQERCSHCSLTTHVYENCPHRNYSQEYINDVRDRSLQTFLVQPTPPLPLPICRHCWSERHVESNCNYVHDLTEQGLETVRRANQERREAEAKTSPANNRCPRCQAAHRIEECPFQTTLGPGQRGHPNSTGNNLSILQAYLQHSCDGIGYQVWDADSNTVLPVKQDRAGDWYVWSVYNKDQYKILRQPNSTRVYFHDTYGNTQVELTQQLQVRRNPDRNGFHLFNPETQENIHLSFGLDGTWFATNPQTQQRHFVMNTTDRGWWLHSAANVRELPVQVPPNFPAQS